MNKESIVVKEKRWDIDVHIAPGWWSDKAPVEVLAMSRIDYNVLCARPTESATPHGCCCAGNRRTLPGVNLVEGSHKPALEEKVCVDRRICL